MKGGMETDRGIRTQSETKKKDTYEQDNEEGGSIP